MEDDLVKQHKNKSKKNKCSEKPNLSEENIIIPNIPHGVKRSNSSVTENKSCKITKKNHLISSNTTNVSQTQEVENVAATPTVARAIQIWSPCQITRDSQTTADLLTPKHCYNIPLTNNVMPAVKHNKYKNMCIFMDPHEQKQESLTNQLQPLTVPFYTTPMPDHIPQNSNLLQPCLYYHNQLLLQPYNNIQCASKMSSQNEPSAPMISKGFQVNQEEVITSSDSDCRREIGSLKSSSKWMYDSSSFYSSTLREKTDSSEVEDDYVWPAKFNKTQVIKKIPIWKEDIVTSPDLIFRYQIEHRDKNEVLKKDMNALNKYTQPLLVNEQLGQLYELYGRYEEVIVNGASEISSNDGTSMSSGEDDRGINIGEKKRKVDFSKWAMLHEENAPMPPPTTVTNEI